MPCVSNVRDRFALYIIERMRQHHFKHLSITHLSQQPADDNCGLINSDEADQHAAVPAPDALAANIIYCLTQLAL
jgi:hypothetical protein